MILDKNINPETYKSVSSMLSRKLFDGRKNAKKKGWQHDIDHAFIIQLIRQSGCKCVYCGKPFVFKANHPMNFSIDRIDSSRGYVKDNVQVIANWVNKAKSDMNEHEFFDYIKDVYNQVFTNKEK